MSNCSPEKEGKLVFNIGTLEGFLVEEFKSLSESTLERFREHLNDDSLTLLDLGYLLVSGGLIDLLGENHIAYLREKGFSEEFLQRARGFYKELEEKYPDFFRNSIGTRKANRAEMVGLGACFLPPTNDAGADAYRYHFLIEIAAGRMKPPDSWVKEDSQ